MIMPELSDRGEEFGSEAVSAEPGRKPPAYLQAHDVQRDPSGSQAAGAVHSQKPVIKLPGPASALSWFHRKQAVAVRSGHHLPGRPAEPPLRLRVASRGAQDWHIVGARCLQP